MKGMMTACCTCSKYIGFNKVLTLEPFNIHKNNACNEWNMAVLLLNSHRYIITLRHFQNAQYRNFKRAPFCVEWTFHCRICSIVFLLNRSNENSQILQIWCSIRIMPFLWFFSTDSLQADPLTLGKARSYFKNDCL